MSEPGRQHLAGLLGFYLAYHHPKTPRKNKLYALHAPEVECISKGKARTPYEFGVKVDIATTLKEGLVVAIADIKMDGRLGRNPLKGALGDALHAVR